MLYGEFPPVEANKSNQDGQPAKVSGFPVSILNPPKTALLRLPTEEEILARFSKQITIQTDLGRGGQKNDTPPRLEEDLALFNRLRLDTGGEWNKYEAARALSQSMPTGLFYARVTNVERSGPDFAITVDTYCGPICIHHLSSPLEEDMFSYRDGIVSVRSVGRNKTELHYRHQVALDLYRKCFKSAEGYADGVETPAHHRFNVALALADAVDAQDAPLDPNF